MTSLLLSLLLILTAISAVKSDPTVEKAALLSFLTQTHHSNRIHWNQTAPLCDWTGVTCDPNRTTVTALRLPAVGLVGPIPPSTIGRLSSLRVLSLRSNALSGPLPSDISNLTLLYSLYLHDNSLSGQFPAQLTGLNRLTRLNLAGNNLSGEIPFSLNNLTHLTSLNLENNSFSGAIPSIKIASLTEFNVSNNNLNGSVPETLSSFPESAFAGNLQLCGNPLPQCLPFFPSPSPSPSAETPTEVRKKKKKKLSAAAIVGIAAAGLLGLVLLSFLIFFFCIKKKKTERKVPPSKLGTGPTETGMTSSSKEEMSGVVETERNRLNFVGSGGGYSFDLEDLLRASAEVLGKGSVGTSYKAVLEEGTTVVVKRLKDVAVSKREFELQMEELGRIEHRNLLPVRAYYYSKDEKLMVLDYLPAGSLSAVVHGSRGSGRAPLDWESRMRIALSAGCGLSHLHQTGTVHGNIKASNVLLRPDLDTSVLSDYSLLPLFNPSASSSSLAGYRAPEVIETRKPTAKSDVYSFGVLLLELLTGKSPSSVGEEVIDLPRWVQSVVREEWTAEVFDVELMRDQNGEEEMVQLLQVAMGCVATMPDSRPEMGEVLRMMEEIVRGTAATGTEDEDGRSPPP